MRTVFGIDVSKASSEIAILINGERVQGYSIPNDAIGFSRLFNDLSQVVHPEIILEATGVYSRRLEAFFKNNDFVYTRLNPLEAKNQLDSLRHRKTDKIDAETLAQTQFVLNRKPSYIQEEIFEHLRDLSRFYQNLTEDIARAKNRLHKVLQIKAVHNIVSASRFSPTHIADFYGKRKRQSPNAPTKPYTIASMHRLVRCLYFLITHNKFYDYAITQNQ